jgi:diacylglycerol kinase
LRSLESTEVTLAEAVHRRGSFTQTFKAVAWSFFGVRKSLDNEVDFRDINPLHVVAAGVLSAALFVVSLVGIVGFVVAGTGP